MTTPAIVLGSGRSAWDDLRAIGQPEVPVFAVNDMAVFAPRVDHAVSHHARKLPLWRDLRGSSHPIQLHSSSRRDNSTGRPWPGFHGGGSSALLAVRIALALGHAPIYVAGVPLDGRGHLWSDPADPTPFDYGVYRGHWEQAAAELRGRVTAPSGFLCELLGPA